MAEFALWLETPESECFSKTTDRAVASNGRISILAG